MSQVSPLKEPLLEKNEEQEEEQGIDEVIMADKKSRVEVEKGTVLSRINDITSSKDFLDECTYYISLKGKESLSFII